MYIFISLVFFFVAAIMADGEFDEDAKDADSAEEELSPEQRADAERGLREAETELGLPPGTLQSTLPGKKKESAAPDEETPAEEDDARDRDENINVSLGGFGTEAFEERLERGARAVKDDPQAFVKELLQQIPTAMFVFLPLLAMVLKMLYVGSGRYYVEHLIFTLHFHSAVFVLLLLWLLFGELALVWPVLDPLSGWVTAALWLYLPFHLYKSMRCVYSQGRFVTILKFTLLAFAYFIAIVLMFVMTLLYTLYLQS